MQFTANYQAGITPTQRHIARQMLAHAMTLITVPKTNYRDQIVEMFLEQDSTPQAEFRRMLCYWSGVSDEKILNSTDAEINLILSEFEKDVRCPELPNEQAYVNRYQDFRDWLFEQVVTDY